MLKSENGIRAIDMHCHYSHGVPGDAGDNEIYHTDVAFLKKERERLNVTECVFSTFSGVSRTDRIVEENEHTFALASSDAWLYQWVVIDPRQKNLYDQAERMLKSDKVLGIKIHPTCHRYSILEYGKEIFAFAEAMKTFVVMHPMEVAETVKIADEFPGMKLIIAHMGTRADDAYAIINSKCGNIYLDTSGIASSNNDVIERAVKVAGSEHIFFGTDTYSCVFQKARVLYADIPMADKENILYKNALREFPKLPR